MADHPVENSVEIILKEESASPASSSSSGKVQLSDDPVNVQHVTDVIRSGIAAATAATARVVHDEWRKAIKAIPSPTNVPEGVEPNPKNRVDPATGRFRKFTEAEKQYDAAQRLFARMNAAGSAPPPPSPPSGSPPAGGGGNGNGNSGGGHPDDPPGDWWRGAPSTVTDVNLRRRYWRERRQRIARSFRMENQAQAAQDRLNVVVPPTFQPNVTDPNQRKENWRNYQESQRQQAKERQQQQAEQQRANTRFQQEFERRRKLAAIQRQQVGEGAASTGASFGGSVGSSIGAGLGAKIGGPWGAAIGSWLGGMAGRASGAVIGKAVGVALANPAGAAAVAAAMAPAVGAAVAYGTYSVFHRAANKIIDGGVVPFTAAIARSLPVIGLWTKTIEATMNRFERDKATFGPYAQRFQLTDKINERFNALNRLGAVQDQGFGGKNLDQLMAEMASVQGRFDRANDKMEAAFSRGLYQAMLPLLEKLVAVVEVIAEHTDEIEAFTKGFVDNLPKALKATLLIISTTGGPISRLLTGKIIDNIEKALGEYLDELAKKKQKEAEENAELMGMKIFSDLKVLLHGTDKNDPRQRRLAGALMGRFMPEVPLPPGLR